MAKRDSGEPARKPGRPSKYKDEYAEQARKLYLLGLIDEEVASFFGVSVQTLHNWRAEHPAFLEANAQGKVVADAQVAAKLYERACGYSHPEDDIRTVTLPNGAGSEIVITPTIRHYPPDTTAALKWLFNRQPDRWRDKREDGTNNDLSVLLADLIEKLPG